MLNRTNIEPYMNGQYQGGTHDGCDIVNLFDTNLNVIAVFQKQEDGSYLFLTTCTLTPKEVDHLTRTNGNFLTEKMIDKYNALEILDAVDTNINDFLSTDTNN